MLRFYELKLIKYNDNLFKLEVREFLENDF